jgi:hypothetical protein
MKERPILFSAPMVRAILDGSKTQTRRVAKLPHMNPLGQWEPSAVGGENGGRTRDGKTIPLQGGIWHTRTGDSIICPHGQPSDRLWVRENFYRVDSKSETESLGRMVPCDKQTVTFAADANLEPSGRLRPSIHMPRWASRINLEITGVRVERLQSISERDSRAEGVTIEPHHSRGYCAGEFLPPAMRAYRDLWESINGAGSWGANPWVWVIEFRRVA